MKATNRSLDQYQFVVRPLSKEEGGGFLVEYPDLPGCMSDGETVEEAVKNGREALRDCLEVFKESGRRCQSAPLKRRSSANVCPGPYTQS